MNSRTLFISYSVITGFYLATCKRFMRTGNKTLRRNTTRSIDAGRFVA